MDKLEVLCRAWIDCDPNRAGHPKGSGFHPDDIMPKRKDVTIKDASGRVIGFETSGASEELAGEPHWRWFVPRAVALEQYLEERGYVIVKLDQANK